MRENMSQEPPATLIRKQRFALAAAGAGLLFVLAGWTVSVLLRTPEPDTGTGGADVPLGVEQAVVIRYGGPRLKAQPYRRGASINLRIADEAQRGRTRVYDIRYVISLPGEFDLTKYLTSTDGQPLDDLPPFRVRGLTSLTKDIETRIQEIENVDVRIGHWYYESLVAAGLLWAAWLAGLIFVGRSKRPALQPAAPRPPSLAEQIESLLTALAAGELTTGEKARLEALLLKRWREELGLDSQRMSVACRGMETNPDSGDAYGKLQAWLHNPRAGVGPEAFIRAYAETPDSADPHSVRA